MAHITAPTHPHCQCSICDSFTDGAAHEPWWYDRLVACVAKIPTLDATSTPVASASQG
jgi:hypothetical protein